MEATVPTKGVPTDRAVVAVRGPQAKMDRERPLVTAGLALLRQLQELLLIMQAAVAAVATITLRLEPVGRAAAVTARRNWPQGPMVLHHLAAVVERVGRMPMEA
jgi:hypothetical protein